MTLISPGMSRGVFYLCDDPRISVKLTGQDMRKTNRTVMRILGCEQNLQEDNQMDRDCGRGPDRHHSCMSLRTDIAWTIYAREEAI